MTRERDIADFNRFSDEFFAAAPAERDEQKWFAEQGPFCPDLVQALIAAQKEIDLFFFFTYLYYPTVEGIKAVSKPVILFPTAHDEPPIHLAAMGEVFRRPRALFFLTRAEMDLVRRLFAPPGQMRLVRTGLDIRSAVDEKPFRRRYLLIAPYLLYAGRIEKGKGLEAVFDHYRALKSEAYVDLVLIGKKLMDLPAIQGLKYLGFVSEDDKLAAFKGAVLSAAALAAGEPLDHHPGILLHAHAGAGQPPLPGPAGARRDVRRRAGLRQRGGIPGRVPAAVPPAGLARGRWGRRAWST